MSDVQIQEQHLTTLILTAKARTRATAAQRTAATKLHQIRYNEVVTARANWLNHQKLRNTTTTTPDPETLYRIAQDRETAADKVRKHYDQAYSKALHEEQTSVKNLANWRSFGITIAQQEQEREWKAEALRKAQEVAEVRARRREAEMEAARERVQRERIGRERERRRREQRQQEEGDSRTYFEWKRENARIPPGREGWNSTTTTTTTTTTTNGIPLSPQAFAAACTQWRGAVERAFGDYATISIFPQPPVSGSCAKASCKAELRALKACACDVQKAVRIAGVDLKKERHGWHPDRFSVVVDKDVRVEFQGMAKEVFQVVSMMYESGRG